MLVTRVSCHIQYWVWEVLVWLIDEEGERTVKTIGEEHKTGGILEVILGPGSQQKLKKGLF